MSPSFILQSLRVIGPLWGWTSFAFPEGWWQEMKACHLSVLLWRALDKQGAVAHGVTKHEG